MKCSNCENTNNVFVLQSTRRRLCLQCVTKYKANSNIVNEINENFDADFLNNPNLKRIRECYSCRPLTRGGRTIIKPNVSYYSKIESRCHTCLPHSRGGQVCVLNKTLFVNDSYANKPLKR